MENQRAATITVTTPEAQTKGTNFLNNKQLNSDFFQMPALQPEVEANFISGLTLFQMNTDKIPMLFGDMIPKVGVWAMVGASDTAKSMILRQIAMSVAGGIPFLDWQCNVTHKRAIVVCSEDDEFAISFLLRKQNKSINLSDNELINIQFLFETEDFIEKLNMELTKQPADLVIIDAFSDLFDGKDSHQNTQVRSFLNKFTLMANNHKCSIGFLHHTGKRTEDMAPSKNNALGSQGFEAKMRLVIELRLDKLNTELRHLCVVKGNYLPQLQKTSSIVVKMDENFTFTNTGERVDYSELNEGAKGQQKKIEPSKMEDLLHLNSIRTLFVNDKHFSQNELVRKLMHYWQVSDKTARRFVDFLETQKWIVDVSNNPSRRNYKKNIE